MVMSLPPDRRRRGLFAGVLPVKGLAGTTRDGGFRMQGRGVSADGEDEGLFGVFAAGAASFTDGALVP